MEKYRPNPEQLVEPIEAQLDSAMDKVDSLVQNGFEMKKIGELIRVIDYLAAVSRGENPALPEPDPELYKKVKWDNTPNRIPVQSPDRVFAQMVYGVIPEGVKRNNLAGACEVLNEFLSGLVKDTDKTKSIKKSR